jgi:hypothetical protein
MFVINMKLHCCYIDLLHPIDVINLRFMLFFFSCIR